MWGTSINYPSVASYAEAARLFERTKPLRGKPDFRPLDQRSSRAKSQIKKVGEAFVIQLYRTDIIAYYPDGSVHVNCGGWSTASTAEAVSAMSPLSAWNSKGNFIVASRKGPYVDGTAPRFVLPSGGLLFEQTTNGLVPRNPPKAEQRKTRVKREEASAARKFFKPVVKYIEAFSAAFEGGVKPVIPAPDIRSVYAKGVLSDEDAVALAWVYIRVRWGGRERVVVNCSKLSVADFWGSMYRELDLVETYYVELPYGEVPK